MQCKQEYLMKSITVKAIFVLISVGLETRVRAALRLRLGFLSNEGNLFSSDFVVKGLNRIVNQVVLFYTYTVLFTVSCYTAFIKLAPG